MEHVVDSIMGIIIKNSEELMVNVLDGKDSMASRVNLDLVKKELEEMFAEGK